MLSKANLKKILQYKSGLPVTDPKFLEYFDAAIQLACGELPNYGDFFFLERVAELSLVGGTYLYELPYYFHHFGEIWSRISLRADGQIQYLARKSQVDYEVGRLDVVNDTSDVPAYYLLAEPLNVACKDAGTVAFVGTAGTGVGTDFAAGDIGRPLFITDSISPRFIATVTNPTTFTVNKPYPSGTILACPYVLSPPPRKQMLVYPKPKAAYTLRVPYIGRLIAPMTDSDYVAVPEDLGALVVALVAYEFRVLEQDEPAANREWAAATRLMQRAIVKHTYQHDSRELPTMIPIEKRKTR